MLSALVLAVLASWSSPIVPTAPQELRHEIVLRVSRAPAHRHVGTRIRRFHVRADDSIRTRR
jgi:hypothetical protein